MSASDSMIVDITTRILQDLADPQTINNMSDEAWREPLWSALEEAGLTLAWVPEEMGGAGIPVVEGFDVLQVAGAFALPVPLAETLLAGWLLAKAGIQPPAGATTVAPVQVRDHFALSDDGTVSGRARGVPFARDVAHIAVLVAGDSGAQVALIETAQGMFTGGQNLAGEAKDTLALDSVAPIALAALPGGIDQDLLMLMGAAARSMQMAGALQALLDISVQYSGERVAFERPIAKFQAVQHNLAQLADEAAAAIAASGSAARALDGADAIDEAVFLDVASAKIRTGEAAGVGAGIAHQVHGAIGFTKEHILHRYSHRLWSWRDDFGDESYWAVRLGERIAAKGADALWPTITAA